MSDWYQVQFTTAAAKDFRKLDPSLQSKIQTTILHLKDNQTPHQFKVLMGKDIAQYRVRVGDYRILYDVYHEDKIVLILRIGHRKDVYK